jgi:hypothetical protein
VLRESSHAELWGSSHAVLRESSHAVLRDSSHAVLWDSSHAVLRESSHAVLRESSHAELWGSSHAVLRESSHAVLSKFACAHIYGKQARCKGGVQIKIPDILTAKEWCDYYGVAAKRGIVILFKGTDENFHTQKSVYYKPGTIPRAPDWDGGKAECGGGLHFSPCVSGTLRFKSDAKKFVACPVRVKDIVVHKDAQFPDKIKAEKCCAPVWEVNRDGETVA